MLCAALTQRKATMMPWELMQLARVLNDGASLTIPGCRAEVFTELPATRLILSRPYLPERPHLLHSIEYAF